MYYSKLRNRTIQTYHKISTFPYSLSSLFVGKSKIDTLTSKNPQLQSPHRLVSSYCPESFDGFVKNKLPGKLFLTCPSDLQCIGPTTELKPRACRSDGQ